MFLLETDFKKQIQDQILQMVIEQDSTLLYLVEQTAIAEMTGYLTARYRCDLEFADIYTYNNFDSYQQGQRVLHQGLLYTPAPVLSAGAPLVVPPNNAPPPLYDPSTSYQIGNNVLYMPYNHTYTAIAATTNNPPSDANYWQPINAPYWIQQDTRNPLLLTYCIDIALYHLHSRINPRQVPELRQTRYDQVIRWLREVSAQKINPHLTQDDPNNEQGTGHDYLLFGGNNRRNQHY